MTRQDIENIIYREFKNLTHEDGESVKFDKKNIFELTNEDSNYWFTINGIGSFDISDIWADEFKILDNSIKITKEISIPDTQDSYYVVIFTDEKYNIHSYYLCQD
ncbi:hypothetical protein COB55_04465 [Candidatus Wolfebacteria bacterium]|nr:MAG: hypothetical protein COB55_04465 [Candidatus Wolfebacteria bacterium]